MDIAATKVKQSQNLGKEAVELYDKAQSEMQTKMAAAAFAAENWIRVEHQLYPWAFAPPRNIINKLIKKKSKYISEDSDAEVTKSNSAPVRGVKQVNVTVATSPNRVLSQQVLEGERFPQTRMRILSTDDVVEMSKEDLRYAINEMYARYGMTFRDKSYQAHFDGLGWYRPDDKWTVSQIEKVFTETERKNLGILINEREYRQDEGY